jgi:hypothetical protein
LPTKAVFSIIKGAYASKRTDSLCSICCTIRDDLLAATQQICQRPDSLDYILVETSGVFDPLAVAHTFLLPPLRDTVTLAAIAAQYARVLKQMMVGATALSVLFTITGLLLSYFLNRTSGATIILAAGAVYLVSLGIRPLLRRTPLPLMAGGE